MSAADHAPKLAYSISVPGATEAIEASRELEQAFEKVRLAKVELNKELAKAVTAGDATDALRKQIADLEKQLKALAAQRTSAEKEALAQARAEKELAVARAADAKAAESLAKAEAARVQSSIAQDKELDRLIAQEEKQAAALKKQQAAAEPLAGSYAALYKEYRELYKLVKDAPKDSTVDFRGQLLQYDEAVDKLKALASAEQDFRRQFSKDGLLVGEYTSGIVKAFKNAGLGDIIKGQLSKGQDELKRLNQEFDKISKELSDIGVNGSGNLELLEKQLLDNRKAANELQQELGEMRSEFRGIGDVGDRITGSISNNFKSMKENLKGLVLGLVGFQALLGGIGNAVTINMDFEDAVNELKAITGVGGRDLDFLRQKALETSEVTRFSANEILESFKLIASAKPELLQNVDALNQMKDAAVLLAQASGQALPEAVENLTNVMNQFGAGADEAARYVDALAAGAKYGAAEIPAITDSMLKFGTQAASSNVSVQESIALIELLAEKGQQGAEAGTKLRNVLLKMSATKALSKEALDQLKKAGVDTDVLGDKSKSLQQRLTELSKIQNNTTALVKVFGEENVIAGQIVLQNVDRYAELAGQVGELGVAQAQAGEMTNSASTAWAKLKNQFTNLLTSKTVISILMGLAAALGFVVANIGVLLPLVALITGAFALYRIQLAAAAFAQGTLAKESFAYGVLATLNAARIGILNVVQGIQNALLVAYTAIQIRAAAATGLSAGALTLLGGAFRFLTGPIGLTIGLTVALLTAFGTLSSHAKDATKAANDLSKSEAQRAAETRVNLELDKRVADATSSQVARIKELTAITNNASISEKTRRAALEELIKISPSYRDALDGEAINIDKVRAASDALITSLQKQARAKAIADLTAEKEQKIFELESKITILRRKATADDNQSIGNILRTVGSAIGIGDGSLTDQYFTMQADLQKEKDELQQIYKMVEANGDLQQAIIDKAGTTPGTGTGTGDDTDTKKYGGARLTGQQKDQFADINSKRDADLRAEKERYRALQAERVTDEQDEITHLQKLQQINTNAVTMKLGMLKGANAAERKLIEDLKDERTAGETDLAQKVYELREQAAKRLLDQARANAQAALDAAADADPVTKAQAQVTYQQAIIAANDAYYRETIAAASDNKNRIAALEKAKADAALEANRQLNKGLKNLRQERYDEEVSNIRQLAALQQSILATQTQQRMLALLQDKALTKAQRERALDKLNQENEVNDLTIQINANNQEIALMKRKYGFFAQFQKEYTDLVLKNAELATQRQKTLNDQDVANTRRAWKAKEESLLSYVQQRLGLDEQEMQIVQAGGRLAEQFLQQYFDRENRRLEQKRQASLERLGLEKNERLADAQSLAEKETIEKEFAQRTKDEEQKAAKEKKKMALKQLAIDSAVAAIKAFATAPNYIVGAIQAAAIGVAYLFNRQKIQEQQFEKGGMLRRAMFAVGGFLRRKFARGGDVPTRGGEFGGRRHSDGGTPFSFQGTGYEAEVGELAIINRRSAMSKRVLSVTGTARQIASAINEEGGGVGFAGGARLQRFAQGGYLGSRLQAPQFVPARTYAGQSDNADNEVAMAAIIALGDAVVATSDRIDRMEVVLVPSSVTAAQKKEAKAVAIGTL